MKISFDFDGTLEYENVQKVAKDLIASGYNVCILTTRYSDPSNYYFPVTHDELYRIAKDCGITEINFTEFEWKCLVIDKLGIELHIDDNYEDEVRAINSKCKARAITYNPHNPAWDIRVYDAITDITKHKNIVLQTVKEKVTQPQQ